MKKIIGIIILCTAIFVLANVTSFIGRAYASPLSQVNQTFLPVYLSKAPADTMAEFKLPTPTLESQQQLEKIADSIRVELTSVPNAVWNYAQEYMYRQTVFTKIFGAAGTLDDLGLNKTILPEYTAGMDWRNYDVIIHCPDGKNFHSYDISLQIHGQFDRYPGIDTLFVVFDEQEAKNWGEFEEPEGPQVFSFLICGFRSLIFNSKPCGLNIWNNEGIHVTAFETNCRFVNH